jgi:hypothetical protein
MKLYTHQYRGHGSAVEVMLWHGRHFFFRLSFFFTFITSFVYIPMDWQYIFTIFFFNLIAFSPSLSNFSAFSRIEETYDDMKNSIFSPIQSACASFFIKFLKCFFMSLIIHTRYCTQHIVYDRVVVTNLTFSEAVERVHRRRNSAWRRVVGTWRLPSRAKGWFDSRAVSWVSNRAPYPFDTDKKKCDSLF